MFCFVTHISEQNIFCDTYSRTMFSENNVLREQCFSRILSPMINPAPKVNFVTSPRPQKLFFENKNNFSFFPTILSPQKDLIFSYPEKSISFPSPSLGRNPLPRTWNKLPQLTSKADLKKYIYLPWNIPFSPNDYFLQSLWPSAPTPTIRCTDYIMTHPPQTKS